MVGGCFIFLVTLVVLTAGQAAYPNTKQITPDYILSWRVNATHIEFQTEVQTAGFFGFGISGDGFMYPADVVVGYWNHGKAVFNDYHTTGHMPPVMDKSQDWSLVSGTHSNQRLTFTFVRALDTGDADGDMVIHRGNTHVIWAIGDQPTSPTGLPYHNSRGSVDINLVTNADVVGK